MVEIEPNAINDFVNEATLKFTSRKFSVRGISEIKIANILRSICAIPGLALRDGWSLEVLFVTNISQVMV